MTWIDAIGLTLLIANVLLGNYLVAAGLLICLIADRMLMGPRDDGL